MTLERQRHFPFRSVLLAGGVWKGVDGLGMDGSLAHFLQDASECRRTAEEGAETADSAGALRGCVRSECSISRL